LVEDTREAALRNDGHEDARGTLMRYTWPSYRSKDKADRMSREPVLDPVKWLLQEQTHMEFFIPITWCEDIQQKEFWNIAIRKFGGDCVKPFPLLRGTTYVENLEDPRLSRKAHSLWRNKSLEEYVKRKTFDGRQNVGDWPQTTYDRISRAVKRHKLHENEDLRRRKRQRLN